MMKIFYSKANLTKQWQKWKQFAVYFLGYEKWYPHKWLVRMYKFYIESNITYGMLIYGTAPKTDLQKFIQNKKKIPSHLQKKI